MTDMEKKVMIRFCAKILTETKLYETDTEVRGLVDWVCVSKAIKKNNNEIHNLIREYKQIEPECRKGIREKWKRMEKLCEERNHLYEKQNELKGQRERLERGFA